MVSIVTKGGLISKDSSPKNNNRIRIIKRRNNGNKKDQITRWIGFLIIAVATLYEVLTTDVTVTGFIEPIGLTRDNNRLYNRIPSQNNQRMLYSRAAVTQELSSTNSSRNINIHIQPPLRPVFQK